MTTATKEEPDMSASAAPETRRRRGPIVAIVVGVVVLLVAVIAGGAILAGPRETYSAKDMHGQTVQLDPGVIPVPAKKSQAVSKIGGHLVVPSVGLDVPLGALNESDGRIIPPGFTSAYWVRNMGVSVDHGDQGSVYVVMHSLRNGGVGPGNYLIDIAHQRSKVSSGARVTVDGVAYTVTGSQLIGKGDISSDDAVWANTPGRLVLITCLQHADGTPSTQNLVITATRDAA